MRKSGTSKGRVGESRREAEVRKQLQEREAQRQRRTERPSLAQVVELDHQVCRHCSGELGKHKEVDCPKLGKMDEVMKNIH